MNIDTQTNTDTDKGLNICKYCNKYNDDFFTNNCCHSTKEFINTLNNLCRYMPSTIDDFIYSQPPKMVIDAIKELDPSLLETKIEINFDKIKKILLTLLNI
jgi:hypothetical protein